MSESGNKNKRLFAAVLIIALIQAPFLALLPSIALIKAEIFPEYPLIAIQTVATLPNLLAVISGIAGAVLISLGKLPKKTAVVLGLSLIAVAGILAVTIHAHFWQYCMYSVIIGLGMGFLVPSISSIMMDSFDAQTLQSASGLQGGFICLGGVMICVFGGLLTSVVWYGAYFLLIAALPIAVFAFIAIPKKAISPRPKMQSAKKTKLSSKVIYYSIFGSLIFVMTYAVSGNNLSPHFESLGIKNYSAVAGIGTAVQMSGGFAAGFFFRRLSAKFGDYVILIGYLCMAIGYTMLNVFSFSLPLMFVAVFILGTPMSLISPQGVVAISKYVDERSSFVAMLLFTCVANGTGGFISPLVYTSITTALGGNSTAFRFQFTGFVSLAIGVVVAIYTAYSLKKVRRDNTTPD